jgi:hypothetical protein
MAAIDPSPARRLNSNPQATGLHLLTLASALESLCSTEEIDLAGGSPRSISEKTSVNKRLDELFDN